MVTRTNPSWPSWSDIERWMELNIQQLHARSRIAAEVREMSEDLPKQDLLVKLLKMTTSENDGEAVVAIRKANALLKSAGWDWDRLIAGKIKIVEDPFKSVADPFAYNDRSPRPKPAPPPPPRNPSQAPSSQPPRYGAGGAYSAQQPGFAPPPPPPPPRKPRGNPIASTKENIYAGWCYCCGDAVLGKQGFIFDPITKNANAKSKWQIVCKACNAANHPNVGTTAFPRQRPLGNATPSLNDI